MTPTNQIEIWEPIKGYEGRYEVSTLGRIKSLAGKMWGKTSQQERVLIPAKAPNGYMRVLLYNSNKRKLISLHRQVAIAFIPNPDNKCCVNHKNGIKTDNRAENLEWCTQKENIRHSKKMGLSIYAKGENVGSSKLNEVEVVEIRSLYKTGQHTNRSLADKFNVCPMTINLIVRYKIWRTAA